MGKLNPLTGRAIYETCVIPVLLYDCEDWVLSDANIIILEAFQGEIGRRILRLSKSHSLLSTRIALQLQSIASRILSRKLSLLHRVRIGGESIGQKVYSELTINGPQRLCLVEECLSLEDKVGCNGVTQDILDGNSASARGWTKVIAEEDWEKCLCDAQIHQSTHIVAKIASSTSWLKLWDMALDHGQQGTLSLQTLFRVSDGSEHHRGISPSPLPLSPLSTHAHWLSCHPGRLVSHHFTQLCLPERDILQQDRDVGGR